MKKAISQEIARVVMEEDQEKEHLWSAITATRRVTSQEIAQVVMEEDQETEPLVRIRKSPKRLKSRGSLR